jgi:hypothetical protein
VLDDVEVVLAVDDATGISLWRVSAAGRVGWTRRFTPASTAVVDLLADAHGALALLTCSAQTQLDASFVPQLSAGAVGGADDICVLDLRR